MLVAMDESDHVTGSEHEHTADKPAATVSGSSAHVTEVLIARAQAELADAERAYDARMKKRDRERAAADQRKATLDRKLNPEAEAWVRRARALVRQAGHNRGAARDTLIRLFAGQNCAVNITEVEETLEFQGRHVARASIYRALEILSDLGLVVRVDVGHGAARYERAYDHDEEHHHHHLVCDTCGLLIPFDDEHLELVIDGLSERLGFETKGHEVTLRGTCEDCRLGVSD
jgi:Fur family transcriptional regulator, ferric uptake regulator